MMLGSFYFALVIYVLSPIKAYKILFFAPKFGRSHVTFLGNIADKLVEAGHDVTMFLPEVNIHVGTNGTKLAKIVTVPIDPKISEKFSRKSFLSGIWLAKMQSPFSLVWQTDHMTEGFTKACENTLEHVDTLNKLKSERFDLAMLEVFDGCSLGLLEILEIKAHILVSPSPLMEFVGSALGVPNFPSYVPAVLSSYTDQMTYTERVVNLMLYFISQRFFIASFIASEQKLFNQKYGENFVDLKEKIAQASFIFVNSDPFYNYPRPLIHKVVDISGISIPHVKPLNERWQKVMNLREKTILVSFGSVAESSTMPAELKQAFLKAFDQFPDVTFIWKYEIDDDKIDEGHPNVVTSKWLPQSDLLAHPKLVAFITHGGMNSITEATNYGKPLISIPLFGDQMRNTKMVEKAGLAIPLLITNVMADHRSLSKAIKNIITDQRYALKAEYLAMLIANRPNAPEEQMLNHVQFAAEFGRLPNLDPYSRKMSYVSYLMLDIIIPALVIISCILLLIIYLAVFIIRRCIAKFSKKKKTQ